MSIPYGLQRPVCTITRWADAGWIGEVGPYPSFPDPGAGSTSMSQNITKSATKGRNQ
ncbi:hypothetical protein ACWGIU_07425 [Streptomyces sp. NPDC054840]